MREHHAAVVEERVTELLLHDLTAGTTNPSRATEEPDNDRHGDGQGG
jgi:hypothetical protein